MESDAWNHFSAVASKRHQAAARARYTDTSRDSNLRCWRDVFLGFEQLDGGEEEHRPEYSCPFCSEDFDMVGLCCHFDEEHPVETKNGVCPICAASVGLDLVRHLTMQHGNYFKMQRRKKYRRGSSASQTMLSLLRKDLKEGNLQVLLGGSSYMSPAHPMAAPDPFISSLMYKLPLDDSSKDARPESLDEGSIISKSSAEEVVERVEPPLSDKDQRERAQRSEFVQGLVLSTIFDDIL